MPAPPIMVRLNVSLHAASRHRPEELVEAFRFLMASTRVEAGCIDCSAWIDADDRVSFTELWATEADIRRYVCSESFTSLLSVLEFGREATLQFDFVSETRGLDYVAEIRTEGTASHPVRPRL
jgi:quinol monooxygenase YgiN